MPAVLDEQRFGASDQPAEQAGIDRLQPRGQADLLAFVQADIQQATLAVDEHQIQLIETEQCTRLREDALGEIVHASRTLKLDAGLEYAREGPALGLHRITMPTNAVEAQHEQQHQARE